MSNKTMKQRIAVVAVSALTAGVLSVMSAPVANAAPADLTGTGQTGVVVAYDNVGDGTATLVVGGTLNLGMAAGTAVARVEVKSYG